MLNVLFWLRELCFVLSLRRLLLFRGYDICGIIIVLVELVLFIFGKGLF